MLPGLWLIQASYTLLHTVHIRPSDKSTLAKCVYTYRLRHGLSLRRWPCHIYNGRLQRLVTRTDSELQLTPFPGSVAVSSGCVTKVVKY
ncbi:unnamed protein product [Protopolystoma xenopodis]|uniref:Uncharacterized protein n=1 Tax=Protopolystoma xenopodis TaxID=117903 RepID=A0A3S4ZAT7_9PLAT|nr:unnamed protein product [Protopolystoma xenopodis]